ncbi:MAG: serine hydrolase, partial [Lachnospiraceae bacterium]|nr:serine hydrolase [Lachnospiraceae bacterium]
MKKKIVLCGLIICIMCARLGNLTLCAEEGAEMEGQLYARSAVLMDADSGRVLFGKEEDVVRPMASTTKIMTCILALESQKGDQIVAASANAAAQPKVRLGVKEQEQFYLRDLLYALMLESYNDSAVMIAEGISGTVEEFAGLMNQKAKDLGCESTYFVTPNGLDGSDENGTHSTTARDLALIMRYCISQSPCKEEFLEITRTKSYQ